LNVDSPAIAKPRPDSVTVRWFGFRGWYLQTLAYRRVCNALEGEHSRLKHTANEERKRCERHGQAVQQDAGQRYGLARSGRASV